MYRLSLIVLIFLTLLVRSLFLETYPPGFSGHAVGHASLRLRLYNLLFVTPWNERSWSDFVGIVVQDQHGPQSLIEACLTPIFGIGFTESRLIVGLLGLIAVALIIAWGTVAINAWFGLASGLVLGMAPYFLFFSRNGDSEHVNIYWHASLLLLAMQLVVARGLIRDYVLLGVSIGLSVYVYATNQFLLMLIPLVFALKVRQSVALRDTRVVSDAMKWLTCCVFAGVIAGPLVQHYTRIGRLIPVRTPYVVQTKDMSALELLMRRLSELWRELFVAGGDPWYSRPYGCLRDWDLLLLIPGVVMLYVFARTARSQLRSALGNDLQRKRLALLRAHSTYFLIATACILILLGSAPGLLSLEPTFRRVVLAAIGLDIVKAAGVYGIIVLLIRNVPRRGAYSISLLVVLGFTYWQWNAFFNESRAHESNSSHSMTAVVREIKRQVRTGQEVLVLLPETPQLMDPMLIPFLKFELGLPNELPANLKVLDLESLPSGYVDVIVPIGTLRKFLTNQVPLPQGVEMSNIRRASEHGEETFARVDFKPPG